MSFGIGCGLSGIYTSLANYDEWIRIGFKKPSEFLILNAGCRNSVLYTVYLETYDSETINWIPPTISSKEPRFGRRIDPVTNTFENRLTQVSKFKHPEKNNFIFRLSHFLKKTSPKKT